MGVTTTLLTEKNQITINSIREICENLYILLYYGNKQK